MPIPFQFIAPMPPLHAGAADWRTAVTKIEDLGFNTVAISEHVTRGWVMEPLVAMTAAAMATSKLRVLSLVLNNDLHHPGLLAKSIATLDVLSNGRVELGLGAGWQAGDYRALGLPFEPPPTRIARLAESVEVIKDFFTSERVTYHGQYAQIDDLEALPRPIQQPHPPILIGGGGPKMLKFAGTVADIVGIHARMNNTPGNRRAGSGSAGSGSAAVADMSADSITAKVRLVHDAAAAAGRRPTGPVLQLTSYLVRVGRSRGSETTFSRDLAEMIDVMGDSPCVLVGSVDECVDKLVEWRERLGISYWNLGRDLDAVAPIVGRLAGT